MLSAERGRLENRLSGRRPCDALRVDFGEDADAQFRAQAHLLPVTGLFLQTTHEFRKVFSAEIGRDSSALSSAPYRRAFRDQSESSKKRALERFSRPIPSRPSLVSIGRPVGSSIAA